MIPKQTLAVHNVETWEQLRRFTDINLSAISSVLQGNVDQDNLSPNLIIPKATEWASYVPTGSWTANTTYSGRWRRIGDSIEIKILILLGGAPTAANLSVNYLPLGLEVDTSKLPTKNQTLPQLGTCSILDIGTDVYLANVLGEGTLFNTFQIRAYNGGVVSNTAPFTFASGDNICVNIYALPIVGWGVNS